VANIVVGKDGRVRAIRGELRDLSESGLRLYSVELKREDMMAILLGPRTIRIKVLTGAAREPILFGTAQWLDFHERELALPDHCFVGLAFGNLDATAQAWVEQTIEEETA
jgi:hypothetical protein